MRVHWRKMANLSCFDLSRGIVVVAPSSLLFLDVILIFFFSFLSLSAALLVLCFGCCCFFFLFIDIDSLISSSCSVYDCIKLRRYGAWVNIYFWKLKISGLANKQMSSGILRHWKTQWEHSHTHTHIDAACNVEMKRVKALRERMNE